MKKTLAFLTICFLAQALHGQCVTQPYSLDLASGGTLRGEVMIPAGAQGKAPVVLLICGSGPTDMNGNNPQMKNNSILQLAQSLCANGIASVRYDKRGVASSASTTAREEELRFEDYIGDAKGWIEKIASDDRFGALYVAGHSEGALIGMLASKDNTAVKGFISIAGLGKPGDAIIKEQMEHQDEGMKLVVTSIVDTLKQGREFRGVPPALYALFRPSVQPYMISWMKYDPATEIGALKMPVLIVHGKTDIQVSPQNAGLLHEVCPGSELFMVDDMNHVLKICVSTDPLYQMSTYTEPAFPISPLMTSRIATFILGE